MTAARRVIIPGTGDDYRYGGGHSVTIGSTPIAQVPVSDGRVKLPPASGSSPGAAFTPDPTLEREREMLGGMIAGDLDATAVDVAVQHPLHRQIIEAMAGEYVGSVEVAIQLCRGAGIPPEIVGAIEGGTAVGYLAGCVRRWNERSAR